VSRRRYARSHSSPDRGWIVGQLTLGFPWFSNGSNVTNSYFLNMFDFADIDAEALTGRIEQDKSDWFIKRVILNIHASAYCEGVQTSDHSRLFGWAMGTVGTSDASVMGGSPGQPVFGPEAYNLWARQFQSGVMPAYMVGVLPYAVQAPFDGVQLKVQDDNESAAAGFLPTFPMWGPAGREYDFEVSNAGLRNNQVCGILFTQMPGPGGYDWDEGDVLSISATYQVLVQKRRT